MPTGVLFPPRYSARMDISLVTARRYILGRQGLWPGRRWQGMAGTERAMRAMEHLQLDPLTIVTRAHDLMLQARVIGYRPDDWAVLTYERRRFFDWGGWLAVRPIEELPHWRGVVQRGGGGAAGGQVERGDPDADGGRRGGLAAGPAGAQPGFGEGGPRR